MTCKEYKIESIVQKNYSSKSEKEVILTLHK